MQNSVALCATALLKVTRSPALYFMDFQFLLNRAFYYKTTTLKQNL